jgi:uncharacterized membrane protein
MSDLIAVAYPDKDTAEAVRQTLARLTAEHVIELADAVVVTRDQDGKVKLHQTIRPAAAGAAGGALWGGVIGLLFLAPLFGMAIGAAAGGAMGAATDVGVDDAFMKTLGHELSPGSAALIVLVTRSTPDKVLPQIQQYGGTVIQTSLSEEAEGRLREALAASSTAGAATPA